MKFANRITFFTLIIFLFFGFFIQAKTNSEIDKLKFGDEKSEKQHALSNDNSEIIIGGLNESARSLLPNVTPGWEGGKIAFYLNINPEVQNYFTIKFWGNDISHNRLILFVEGLQIGYRHLGDIDVLDHGSEQPAYNNRFYYKTTLLPISLTKGKTKIKFEIHSNGSIWGYGQSFEQYQKPMETKSRGIYSAYTHTDGCFEPGEDEKQGIYPENAPLCNESGEELLVPLKAKINAEIDKLVDTAKPLNQMQMQFLAKAYFVRWSNAYQSNRLIEKIMFSMDNLYLAYLKNPELAQADPSTPNPGWFGLGLAGQVIWLLKEPLIPFLEKSINTSENVNVSRRNAYSTMLQDSRDWNRFHRVQLTNQSIIKDLYGIYMSNKGLTALHSINAFSDNEAVRYLYECVGIQPWLGSDTPNGPAKPMGENFYELTSKGLTKELGYVGYYGEVLDWVTQVYEATRPSLNEPGDQKIKEQLVKVAHARSVFRYPMLDVQGNRTMRIETIVGWRDTYYPGNVVYGQRTSWDGTALEAAVSTEDPTLIGYAQQMLNENQLFILVKDQLKDGNFRTISGLLPLPDQYEFIKNQAPNNSLLPMTWVQPDFVFSDEEDGVIALKNGKEILYVSVYWRARYAINDLARVHYITPNFDRIAVVNEQTSFEPSGMTYSRPNWTDFGFGNGGHTYPGTQNTSAHFGEKLPIAKVPAEIKFHPGQENAYAGKGEFYYCKYGKYLIGMNCTMDKVFNLEIPKGYKKAFDLTNKRPVSMDKQIVVTAKSTIVLVLK